MSHNAFRTVVHSLIALISLTAVGFAENWPEWRGPNRNGLAAGEKYPKEWSEDKNIIWKVALPGWGTSTPVIWEDRIFATCCDESTNRLVCLNRQGQELWNLPLGKAQANRNHKASGANPSPVTDGQHVYAYFKSGDLACVDFEGKAVWKVNLQDKYGPDRLNWDLGTSPLLTSNLVVVAVMHQGPSYLAALDKRTGEVAWKIDRNLGAPAEARDSYSTPLLIEQDGQEVVVVLGADFLTAYTAQDGNEIWRVGGFNPRQAVNYRSIASPAVVGEIVVAPYARGSSLTAVKLGGEGDVSESHVVWTGRTAADVPTPVALDNKIYISGDRGEVACLDASTGETIWTHRLPRNRYAYSSSPIIAGGLLYVTREDGTTFVLRTGTETELVATNALRENTYATPVFVDGKVYLRTSDWLFCIGTP